MGSGNGTRNGGQRGAGGGQGGSGAGEVILATKCPDRYVFVEVRGQSRALPIRAWMRRGEELLPMTESDRGLELAETREDFLGVAAMPGSGTPFTLAARKRHEARAARIRDYVAHATAGLPN